ncbi:MAG: transcription antitermination factor NusB [Planctomycetes bacterium]|nr:transcription antitermination factor NusB [Planctomycetota bacterium]MCW8134976.1 transcription antitermination factor NusB [Planctomycetota bacterium]
MDTAPTADVRTQGRELALKLLYALDVTRPETPEGELNSVLEVEAAPAAVADFARVLVQGVNEHLAELDKAIQDAAVNWQVSRMPFVDRAVLRMGAFELLHLFDVPPKVSINEAVELAKKYSTEKSGSFVNGVLDKVFQTHCPQKV